MLWSNAADALLAALLPLLPALANLLTALLAALLPTLAALLNAFAASLLIECGQVPTTNVFFEERTTKSSGDEGNRVFTLERPIFPKSKACPPNLFAAPSREPRERFPALIEREPAVGGAPMKFGVSESDRALRDRRQIEALRVPALKDLLRHMGSRQSTRPGVSS